MRWIILGLMLGCAMSAFAGSCGTGTVSSYAGTTCSIGNLLISFGATGTNTSGIVANPTVTPYINGKEVGFTFSNLPGVSVSGNGQQKVASFLYANSVSLLNGATLTGAGGNFVNSQLSAGTGSS